MDFDTSKIVTSTGVVTQRETQKTEQKAATNTIAPKDDVNLDGLSALGAQKMSLVQHPLKSSEWPAETLNKIKDRHLFFFDEGQMPDDETLSFVLSKFYGYKPGDKIKCQSIGVILSKLSELSDEQKDKIFNSRVIDFLYKATDSLPFKFSCLDIPPEELDELNTYLDDELSRHCLEDYLQKEITISNTSASDILKEFKKATSSVHYGFRCMDKSSEFYDLLTKRSYEDVVELSNMIFEHRFDIAGNVDEYHSLLEKLLNAKTPYGKFVFGTNGNASDTSSKSLISGVENILIAKDKDEEAFNNFMFLLELTKEGKLPSSVLGTLAKDGKIDREVLDAAKKAEQGAPFIKDFDDLESAKSSSDPGDVVSVGEEVFYRDDNELKKLDMDIETFRELFPPLETMAVAQGQNGDCYLVSAIVDFIKNTNARGKIYQMFSQDGEDIVVTIPDAKEYPVRFSKKVVEKDGEKNIRASLGVQMLESAYSKTRALKYGTADKLSAIEGGNQCDVYNALLGKTKTQIYIADPDIELWNSEEEIAQEQSDIARKIEEQRRKIKNLEDKDTLCGHFDYVLDQEQINRLNELEAYQRMLCEDMKTMQNTHKVSQDELFDMLMEVDLNSNLVSVGTKTGKNMGHCYSKDRLIYGGHAYSIRSIDKENKTISLINPWNSAQNIDISFREFGWWFDALNIAEI